MCRDSVAEAPWKLEAEKKRQEVLQAVLAAPKPDPPPLVAGTEPAGPSSMETDAAAAADFPE